MEITAGKRMKALLWDVLFFIFTGSIGMIVNSIWFFKKGKTIGTHIMGFKVVTSEAEIPRFWTGFWYHALRLIILNAYILTFGGLLVYDISTMWKHSGRLLPGRIMDLHLVITE